MHADRLQVIVISTSIADGRKEVNDDMAPLQR